MLKTLYARLIILLLVVFCGKAWAVLPWIPTDEEFRSLPPYCKVKMTSAVNSAEYTYWFQLLGKDFEHVHHYCAGMNFAARSYRLPDKQDRIYYRNQALANYKYMFDHAHQEFSLMPDVYMSRGRLYLSGDKAFLALADFKKAVELNPGFTSGYLAQADWYVKFKMNNEALAVITEGLRQVPDSKALQRRYTKLGGVLPYPEPVSKTAGPANAEQSAGSGEGPAAGVKSADGQPENSPASVESGESKVTSSDKKDTSGVVQPESAPAEGAEAIGNTKNPWCRFCPDLP